MLLTALEDAHLVPLAMAEGAAAIFHLDLLLETPAVAVQVMVATYTVPLIMYDATV